MLSDVRRLSSRAHCREWPKWPHVDGVEDVLDGMRAILNSRVWTSRAPGDQDSVLQCAEAEIARLFGVRYALLVTSGTVAVELAVRALQLPQGAKVIVPALGWFATAAAVIRAGAIPIFADISPETSCLDLDAVRRCVDADVRAIVVVHLHCAIADLDGLGAIAREYGLDLIEDCAQTPGGRYHDRCVGGFGRIGCFSFNQEKLIAVGEGGCVVTNEQDLYLRLYAMRTDGYVNRRVRGRDFVPHGSIRGGNACPSEFVGLLTLMQLRQFHRLNAVRLRNATRLDEELALIPGVRPLQSSPGTTFRVWYEYAFRLDLSRFGRRTIQQCGEHLSLALDLPIHATDEPTQDCPMLQMERDVYAAPAAARLHETLLVFHHRALLDDRIVGELKEAILSLQHLGQ